MSSGETVSDSGAEGSRDVAGRVKSLAKPLLPGLSRQAESGNLAAASGVVSLVRAARTFRKGNRKRGALQALGGLFWVGVAFAQRQFGGSRSPGGSGGPGRSHSGDELSEVVGTSPDVDEAVEPGGRETDHATGEEVVNTTDADIDETDTAPEEDLSPGVEREVEGDETDQRDVAERAEVENVTETGEEGESGAFSESESTSESDESPETDLGATDESETPE